MYVEEKRTSSGVADVTTGTATTAQTLYNPLPAQGCDCNRSCNC